MIYCSAGELLIFQQEFVCLPGDSEISNSDGDNCSKLIYFLIMR